METRALVQARALGLRTNEIFEATWKGENGAFV